MLIANTGYAVESSQLFDHLELKSSAHIETYSGSRSKKSFFSIGQKSIRTIGAGTIHISLDTI